jgi:hypothetical protein
MDSAWRQPEGIHSDARRVPLTSPLGCAGGEGHGVSERGCIERRHEPEGRDCPMRVKISAGEHDRAAGSFLSLDSPRILPEDFK